MTGSNTGKKEKIKFQKKSSNAHTPSSANSPKIDFQKDGNKGPIFGFS